MYYYPYGMQIAQPQPQPQFPFPWRPPTMGTIIDSGIALKSKTGSLRIRFNKNFTKAPTVVVSSFWKGQNSQVGHVETIDSVNRNGFTVVSNNAADNYYVSWIAVQND